MNAAKANNIRMEFEDNDILALLSGEHNQHLAHIEKSLDVTLDSFGNSIKISGPVKSSKTAQRVIEDLYKKICTGGAADFDKTMIDDALRWVMTSQTPAAAAATATLDAIAKKFGTAADKTGLVAEAKALGMSDEARRPRDAEGEGDGRVGRRRAGCNHWGRRPSPPGAHSFARTRHRPTSPHDKRCL